MHIEHVALWTPDIERLRDFYVVFFGAVAGARYVNERTGFESCFLRFGSGARLELMSRAGLEPGVGRRGDAYGYAHLALDVGTRAQVDELTERLREHGHSVASAPRTTGDGYYESVVLDSDGNRIELTAMGQDAV